MPEEGTALVEAARRGDLAAFESLIARYEGAARAAALAATRDPDAARDVVQEAFLDAYRLLHQLREPRAFAGWLRRIVAKHADRWRRRRRERTWADPAGAEMLPDPGPGPDPALDRARLAERVRGALDGLPPDLREATTLFYLGERTAAEIAADLDLPTTTIKKRLHSARQRLREEFEMDAELRREFSRPDLPSEVRFFLAVRAGRQEEVAELLDAEPELVRAYESWSRDEALRDDLPYADHAPALARAAAQGDEGMLGLLLDRGAAVDAACDCAAAETALFNAVGAGRAELVERLLASGADPDRASGAGTTPLHLAAHAGHPECAELLLAHGARPDALDFGGRSPADWAQEHGHTALADRLVRLESRPEPPAAGAQPGEGSAAVVGRVLGPDGSPLDGGVDVDWRRPGAHRAGAGVSDEPRSNAPIVHTGVKTIDLFCPLPRSGNVEVRGSAGLGIMVTLGELAERVARAGGLAVWCAFESRGDEGNALRAGLRELGVDRRSVIVLARKAHREGRHDGHDRAVHTAFEVAEGFASSGAPAWVFLMADETRDEVVARALANRPEAVGLFVARARIALPSAGLEPFGPPWDARLLFDPALAARQLWPSIDTHRSESTCLRDEIVGPRHRATASAARAALARRDDRAERLRAYLTQPFHTTTAFTATPGADVALAELLDDVETLLSGECGERGAESLRMIGALG